jgi:signal transduction histidine kinase
MLVLSDISDVERRQQAEREFVANASHEFRTPVASIAAAVEALQSGAQDDPESRERFMGVIERQSARLARLTRSLLVLARAQSEDEPVQLEQVPIASLLDQITASLEPREGVTLRVDCRAGLVALAEPALLEQIVSNLVGNAAKHTTSGEILVRAARRESSVVIEVADNGAGIPWAAQGRVFERFYSGDATRRDGFGLGLAIARDATRALGGALTVESEPGKGTTARVTLRGDAAR